MSTPALTEAALADSLPIMRNRQWTVLMRATMRQWRSRIGLVIVVALVLNSGVLNLTPTQAVAVASNGTCSAV